jgi:hypothetical protein
MTTPRKPRKKPVKTEYQKQRQKFRKSSARHVLVIEADMSEQAKNRVFHIAELLRQAGNELTAIMDKRYTQLMRTKRYRKLKELYGQAVEHQDECLRKSLANQMDEMQAFYHVTWDDCRKAMTPIAEKYGLSAVLALTKAEDIWDGVDTCLYRHGEQLHFSKYGNYSTLRAKQINRELILKVRDGDLVVCYGKDVITLLEKDRFHHDELTAIIAYLADADAIDRQAVADFQNTGVYMDTYRPCYATLVPRIIRGRRRVFVHITVEGRAKPKFDKFGNPRHSYGTGNVGCDIGTQTIAFTSDHVIGLKNLAERGTTIPQRERKARLLKRAMERSRRATNPENYNADGTIRKGKKMWRYSNHYRKLKAQHAELSRINAENRRLAINADVNYLRSLGDVFITEPKNADRLKRRAKKTTINANGKYNRKKRFGKSVQNRCPGYFQSQVQKKFTSTGGSYYEVPNDYRASQYDHTSDIYIKKKLSQRMYHLSDGTEVQRDWYSSYLLYCFDSNNNCIDKLKCKTRFSALYQQEQNLIAWIRTHKIHIFNSGIKVA